MIKFHNGYEMDFACASGALAFDGDGWWWEQPARWLGYLKPNDLTVITKTLTFNPLKGNLRWWCPWRCVRLIPGGAVNAVGLTNPGYEHWIENSYPKVLKRKYSVIVSIYPNDEREAAIMVFALNKCNIVGIQVNLSCPNVKHDSSVDKNLKIMNAVLFASKHPVSVKLAYQDQYVEMSKSLDNKGLAFIELINTVPWSIVFPDKPSPLARYGLEGGVSGLPIKEFAREALRKAAISGIKTPIATGGGISCTKEIYARKIMGAKAFILGTSFLRKINEPNKIIEECRSSFKSR